MPEYDPRIGEIAIQLQDEWLMGGLADSDSIYFEFAAEVATRYAAEQAQPGNASTDSRRDADSESLARELHDVVSEFAPETKPWERLTELERDRFTKRARWMIAHGWIFNPPTP